MEGTSAILVRKYGLPQMHAGRHVIVNNIDQRMFQKGREKNIEPVQLSGIVVAVKST